MVILKANGNFETNEQRNALGIISIRVGDLLISGGDVFAEYISQRRNAKSDVDRYGGNKSTYVGMEIEKANDSDAEGIIHASDNYEGVNHIEFPTK